MHSALRLALPFLSLLAACTTETIVKQAPAAQAPADGEGGGATGDVAPACVVSDATPALEATVLGAGAVEFADGVLGFGYVDAAGVPTLELALAAASKLQWPKAKARFAKYGASYVTTALAHNGGVFGFGWYTERDDGAYEGVWSTMFATASISGATTSAQMGNAPHGRSGVEDLVQARYPRVLPRGDGFLLLWQDRRTKEPMEYNVNLAGWTGIYGRPFDAAGAPLGSDVQIAQPTDGGTITGVAEGEVTMPIWTVHPSDFAATTIHARPATTFTPAEAPAAVATFTSLRRSTSASARGANGEVLVVVGRSDSSYTGRVGSLVLDMSAQVRVPYADWPEEGLENVGAAATADGFVVASVARSEATADLRLFFLDAKGRRLREDRVALPVTAETELGPPALRVDGATVEAALIAYGADSGSAGRKATVLHARACAD